MSLQKDKLGWDDRIPNYIEIILNELLSEIIQLETLVFKDLCQFKVSKKLNLLKFMGFVTAQNKRYISVAKLLLGLKFLY